jgi:hypothetical protein
MKTGFAVAGALLAAAVQAQEPSFPHKGPMEITVLFPAGTSAAPKCSWSTARAPGEGSATNT